MRDRKFSWNLMENKSLVRKIHLKTFACGIISEDITSGRSPSDIILMLSSMSIFFSLLNPTCNNFSKQYCEFPCRQYGKEG